MKRLFFILTAALLVINTHLVIAQDHIDVYDNPTTDFGGRYAVSIKKRFSERFALSLKEDITFHNNHKIFDRSYTYLKADYKLFPFLELSACIASLNYYKEAEGDKLSYWTSTQRAFIEATGSYEIGNWEFSLTERFQQQHKINDYNPYKEADVIFQLKSTVEISYSIPQTKLKPYAAFEFRHNLNDLNISSLPKKEGENATLKYNQFRYSRLRSFIGVEYKIDNNFSVQLYALISQSYDRTLHVNDGGVLQKITWSRENMVSSAATLKISLN